MAFHDIRLPEDVEQGATGGPEFQTSILPMSSGKEQRNVDWSETLHSWELAYGIQNAEDFSVCRAFFYARRGRAHSFRFKDWGDFKLTAETQGVGDGTNKTFQLIKTYEVGGPDPYIRRITRPIAATLHMFVDNVEVGYTLNPLGVVVLDVAPADGAIVTATCEFDTPVRFDTDKFDLELDQPNAGSIGSLPIKEDRE
jgi:uncharacterized protein (TIGR02217 family)